MGVRFDPPAAQPGAPVTVDALALAPRGTVIRTLTASSCLPDPFAVTTSYSDLSCFGEAELVEPLGALPATWTPTRPSCEDLGATPYEGTYYDDDYEETGDTGYGYYSSGSCSSTYPVLVEVQTADGDGYGFVFVDVYDRDPVVSDTPGLWSLDQSLAFEGDAKAGGEVTLEYTIATAVVSTSYPGFHWYVDAGVLVRTGVTAPTAVGEGTTTTENTLRIPEDWHGPLRVVVVATRDGIGSAGADTTWRVLVLDIP